MVLNEKEIREMSDEIGKLIDIIGRCGIITDIADEEQQKTWSYVCNVSDALSWVLGEIKTERFKSDAYLNLDSLKKLIKDLELRSGEALL